MWLLSLFVRPDDDRMTVETCCPSWLSYVNKSMYCHADVHFIVFYLLALRDAFCKVQSSKQNCVFKINFFFLQCHHMSFVDFVVLPPGHGRSVTNVWGWDAHEGQLSCPYDAWGVIEEVVVSGGALNLNSTNLPRPWSPRESSPSSKNSHGRTRNRTRDLMISNQRPWPLDHEAGHNQCK